MSTANNDANVTNDPPSLADSPSPCITPTVTGTPSPPTHTKEWTEAMTLISTIIADNDERPELEETLRDLFDEWGVTKLFFHFSSQPPAGIEQGKEG